MANANVIISVAAVLVALIVTLAVLYGPTDDNGGTTIKISGGFIPKGAAAGAALQSEMYYCAGEHCDYYGGDKEEGFPGYLALSGLKSADGNTYLTEFFLGYTFKFDKDDKLVSCTKLPDGAAPSEVALAASVDGVGEGTVIAVGDDSFAVSSIEKGSDVLDASVFGLKIPTPTECASTSSFLPADARRMDATTGKRRLAAIGYDLWMLAFYTYKTHSGLPEFDRFPNGLSPDVHGDWTVATGLSVTYTETWKNLPFWTTMMGLVADKPDKATGWDAAPTETVTKTITVGKCENLNSHAKIWVNGNDIALGFAGTDVFLLSTDMGDVVDILDDINGWPVTRPAHGSQSRAITYHAGFAEYVDRIDDCIVAVLDDLVAQGKSLKYVTGHSLGGASANIWETFHPEYSPSDGTYTYGAPITVMDTSCEVKGKRYYNDNDPVASHGVAGVVDFDGFDHNMDTAILQTRHEGGGACISRGWFNICLEYADAYSAKAAPVCTHHTGDSCDHMWTTIGKTLCMAMNLGTSHLQYGEWENDYAIN